MDNTKKKIITKYWFFPLNLPLRSISNQEKKWADKLFKTRKYEFHYARAYTRIALSDVLNLAPLSIPLFAAPGKPPFLKNGLGHVSISHSRDALFVAWSNSQIGVDIESINRRIDIKKFSYYLLSDNEKSYIKSENEKIKKEKFLSIWVRKEALVKFSKGNILTDFKSWRIDFSSNKAYKSDKLPEIFVNYFQYKSWLIGVASRANLNQEIEITKLY